MENCATEPLHNSRNQFHFILSERLVVSRKLQLENEYECVVCRMVKNV